MGGRGGRRRAGGGGGKRASEIEEGSDFCVNSGRSLLSSQLAVTKSVLTMFLAQGDDRELVRSIASTANQGESCRMLGRPFTASA